MTRFIIGFILIFIIGCGGGGKSSTSSSASPSTSSRSHIDLEADTFYQFNLAFDDHQDQYEMTQWNLPEESKTEYRFDFSKKSFELKENEEKLFINNQRKSSKDILYHYQNGEVVATVDNQDIFKLSLIEKKSITGKREFPPYLTTIDINGEIYTIAKEYLANLYRIKNVSSNSEIDTLDKFIKAHQNTPFTGNQYRGLVFGKNNTLLELKEQKYTNGGFYEIKTIDNKEILFIYPNDTDNYPKDGCYLIDFNHIEEGECHLKNQIEKLYWYNKNVYDNIVDYLKNSMVEVEIEL